MWDFTKIENGKRILSDDFERLASYICIEIDDTYAYAKGASLREATFKRIMDRFFGELKFVDGKLNHCEVVFSSNKMSPDLVVGSIFISNKNTLINKKWSIFFKTSGDSSEDMLFNLPSVSNGNISDRNLSDILQEIITSIREIY
jgi:hypothetical protein